MVVYGLNCLQHVGPFQIRDGTRVAYTGAWILIHCTTREVPSFYFKLHCPLAEGRGGVGEAQKEVIFNFK